MKPDRSPHGGVLSLFGPNLKYCFLPAPAVTLDLSRLAAGNGNPTISAFLHIIRRTPPGLLLVTAMSIFVWRLALFGHRMLVHGDSLLFGYPLFALRELVVSGHASALWVDNVFGGHPLFAEGQGAFASPVTMLLAAAVTPAAGAIFTANLFPVICMILTGIGMIGLSRSLGLTPWATCFAALAVVFAPTWLDMQSNAGLAGPFLWVPWCLWAFEVWLKRPNVRQATLLGLAVANLLLAGYPQALHGTVIYMAVSSLPIPFYPTSRRDWLTTWRPRIATGILAALLAIGISAVQWITLLELVGQSHRNGGTKLFFEIPLSYFLRGILYTFPHMSIDATLKVVPSIGSLLVGLLATWAIVVNRRSVRLAGHMLATLMLFQMGFGLGWAPFRFVYDHHLLPGLHYFRVVFLYLGIGEIGAALLAGWAVDGIAQYFGAARLAGWNAPGPRRFALGSLLLCMGWGALIALLPSAVRPVTEFVVAFAAFAATLVCGWTGRAALLPAILTVLLVVECAALRLQPFHLADSETVEQPETVAAIKALPDWRDYKVMDASMAAAYSFLESDEPTVPSRAKRMLSSMSGSTTILWDLHGMDGSLALPMARRMSLNPLLDDEIGGRGESPLGSRLIDVLGIRFIAVDAFPNTPGFRLFRESEAARIVENTAALPRFQIFTRHISVPSLDDAIRAVGRLRDRTLVLENPLDAGRQAEMADATAQTDVKPATFTVERAEPTSYRFDVNANQPVWLFLADANYPGWRATLDDVPAPLFSADVLGKAVGVPKGRHTVTVTFHSSTFNYGLWISSASTVLALLALLFGGKLASSRRREGRGQA